MAKQLQSGQSILNSRAQLFEEVQCCTDFGGTKKIPAAIVVVVLWFSSNSAYPQSEIPQPRNIVS